MTVCAFNCKEHTAPVLPCWYCEGKDGEGDTYDPKIHHGWACEACDERRRRIAAADYLGQRFSLAVDLIRDAAYEIKHGPSAQLTRILSRADAFLNTPDAMAAKP